MITPNDIDAARSKLIQRACMYAAGVTMMNKSPQLGDTDLFRKVMEQTKTELHEAAVIYHQCVCEHSA